MSVKDVERVQRWRKNNPERYREYNRNRMRDRRAKEKKFLEKIGFDGKRDTIRKENNQWFVLSRDKIFTILKCNCKAQDCYGLALIENDEIKINLHYNLMKISHILGPSSQCITRKLDDAS